MSSDGEFKDYKDKKAVVNAPLAWGDLRLSEQVKGLRFFRDSENNIVVIPTMLFDPTQVGLGVLPIGRVGISDPVNLSSYARVFGLPQIGWNQSTLGLVTHSTQMLWKGGSTQGEEAQRTPTIFKQAGALAAAGDNVVWTPAGGKKVRVLGGMVVLSKEAAAAGAEIMILGDSGGLNFWRADISAAALVAIGACQIFPINLPFNGFLATAADSTIHINLSAALTAGVVSVSLWGTEE